MKLKCNHCGEVIESGLENVNKHIFEDCKATATEKVSDNITAIHHPVPSFRPADDESNETLKKIVEQYNKEKLVKRAEASYNWTDELVMKFVTRHLEWSDETMLPRLISEFKQANQ